MTRGLPRPEQKVRLWSHPKISPCRSPTRSPSRSTRVSGRLSGRPSFPGTRNDRQQVVRGIFQQRNPLLCLGVATTDPPSSDRWGSTRRFVTLSVNRNKRLDFTRDISVEPVGIDSSGLTRRICCLQLRGYRTSDVKFWFHTVST